MKWIILQVRKLRCREANENLPKVTKGWRACRLSAINMVCGLPCLVIRDPVRGAQGCVSKVVTTLTGGPHPASQIINRDLPCDIRDKAAAGVRSSLTVRI